MSRRIDFGRLTMCAALDFAILMEREARDRYLTLGRTMEAFGDGQVAQFFDRMARMEEHHRVELEARRQALYPGEPVQVEESLVVRLLEGPHTDEEAMGLTLRSALGLALAAETRARDFFLSALEDCHDEDVRRLFGELAEEEILHQDLVKEQLAGLVDLEDEA